MGRSITAGDGSGLAKSLISNETRASPFLFDLCARNSGHQPDTECAWCSRPRPAWGRSPASQFRPWTAFLLCPRARYAACGQTHPPTASTPPTLIKKRSEALKTAFTRLFGMKRRVPPRRRRRAQPSRVWGATPAKEPPVGGGPVGQGRQKREARHCFYYLQRGFSSYSTALDW